jgi:hypothetical protein
MVEITLLGEQSVVDPVGERTSTRSSRSIALLGLLIARTGSPLAEITPDVSAARALLSESVTCASATEALAEEQGSLVVLAPCRADLTNRRTSAEVTETAATQISSAQ